jgi:hypothetical protein
VRADGPELVSAEVEALDPCGFQALNGLYLSGDFGLSFPNALRDALSFGDDELLLLLPLPALEVAEVEEEARSVDDDDTVLEPPCGFHGENGLLASGAFGLLLPNALYEACWEEDAGELQLVVVLALVPLEL